ncbi:hypothetical protein [Kitasatospora aureofaciens]|nr:hypothetical protein [Kitasatospora aureofaciens]
MPRGRVERAGISGQEKAPIIRSEIVIVDDDGNEEPYDPAKH